MDAASAAALAALAAVAAGAVFLVVWWPALRRRRIRRRPFPAPWLAVVRRRLPFFDRMDEPLRAELKDQIKVFVNDVRFIGCAGQPVDDEIRVTVAAQACLLTLGGGRYSRLRSVLVYPSAFAAVREERDEAGLVSVTREELLGESWDLGRVVLAWDSVERGVVDPRDGDNVVLHEFAHQLDAESGAVNGAPPLPAPDARRRWARVFLREYESLKERRRLGLRGLLDEYGATDPAEFFAVATETFFERPAPMAARHGELYEELRRFYRVDPRGWLRGGRTPALDLNL